MRNEFGFTSLASDWFTYTQPIRWETMTILRLENSTNFCDGPMNARGLQTGVSVKTESETAEKR